MKNKTITIILGMILLISSVSAITIIAGNSYSFESEEFEYYTMVGNSSNDEGMNITWEGGMTTITLDLLFKPDDFTLIFFNQEKEIIIEHHYSGGGGSSKTIYKDKEIETLVPYYINNETIVNNSEEIQGYVDIADKAAKGEHFWKLLFIIVFSFILIVIFLKLILGDRI